jgi:hypothetical protein
MLHAPINQAEEYEYLGVTLDSHLTLSSQVSKVYKRVSSRLGQLLRVLSNINPYVAEIIYRVMIDPIITYCYPVYIWDTATQPTPNYRDYKIELRI